MSIAENIARRRKELGMTQKELADKMGVSAVYVGKLLKGGENLTLETICKIQAVTGEEFVSVARPYVSRTVLRFSPMGTFATNAVESEKYYDRQISKNCYFMAAGDAA